MLSDFDRKIITWSGYLGDPLAGAHLKPKSKKITHYESSLDRFIEKNRMSSELSHPEFSPRSVLPKEPATPVLEYGEQLDYGVRQPYFIKPTVLFPNIRKPFLQNEWISFILRVPRNLRLNRTLYKRIVLNAYPELFSNVPTDMNQGLGLTAPEWKIKVIKYYSIVRRTVAEILGISYVEKSMNYLDFESAFREDLNPLARRQIEDLDVRGIIDWIDIKNLMASHMSGEDKSDELRLLISLEMYLKHTK